MFSENELFYKNVYLKECDAEVLSIEESKNGYDVVLTQTIFYPEGGGQSCDTGFINEAHVTGVKRKNDVIIHIVDKELKVGEKVHLKLDWERRYDHMQNHTGEHILSGIIHKLYGYENVGFHMDEEKIQADYDGVLNKEDVEKIEKEINEVIHQNIPVVETYPTDTELETLEFRSKKELVGKVRIITIDDVDICACCGTHVKSTAEVNLIKILSFEKHKNGTRLEMMSGNRALKDYMQKHEQNTKLFQMFSVKPYVVYDAVNKLNNEYHSLQKDYVALQVEYLNSKVNTFTESNYILDILDISLSMQAMRDYANKLIEKSKYVCIVAKKDEENYLYVLASKTEKVNELSKKLNSILNGKGGGKDTFAQGSFHSTKEDIKEKIEEVFKGEVNE